MRLFLDSSVVLAACGRPVGASRYVIDIALRAGWTLLTSTYVVVEVERNLGLRLPVAASQQWHTIRPALQSVADIVTLDRPVLFASTTDRPVLFTAVAFSDVLLTLDRADFGALMETGFYGLPVLTPVMETGFYGLPVLTPGTFLRRERDAGRLPPIK